MDSDVYTTALAEAGPEIEGYLLRGEWPSSVSAFEAKLRTVPGVLVGDEIDKVCPVEHSFVGIHYTRVARCQAGVLAVTKTHRFEHPFFFADGVASVFTEDGLSQRMVAPCWGITRAGTKRVVYMHTDTVMVTVHDVGGLRGVDKAEELIFQEDR